MGAQQRKYKVIFTLVMSTMMSGVMSLVVTLMNLGLIDGLLVYWLKAWFISVVIAMPTMFILTPIVERLVQLIIAPPSRQKPIN